MERFQVTHRLSNDEARQRIERELPRYLRQYGLSSCWTSDTSWVGKRKNLTIRVWLDEGVLTGEVDGRGLLRAAEGRIVAGVRSKLRDVLTRREGAWEEE